MKLYGVFRLRGTPVKTRHPISGRTFLRINVEKVSYHLITERGLPLVATSLDNANRLKDYFENNRELPADWTEKEIKVLEFTTLTTQDVILTPPQRLVAEV